MNESQVRSEDTRIGQPFNPFRLFTGIFIPDGMVRSTSVRLLAVGLAARPSLENQGPAGKTGRAGLL
jgi:hypothetical protein